METLTVKICRAPKHIECRSAKVILRVRDGASYAPGTIIPTGKECDTINSCESEAECQFAKEGTLNIEGE